MVAAVLAGALAGAVTGLGGAALLDNDGAQSVEDAAASSSLQPVQNSGETPARRNAPGSTEAAAAQVLPSVVKIYTTGPRGSGSGSGIILTPQGEILTNNHVVEQAAEGGRLAVSFNDGSSADATIVGRDPLTDLAVIRAEDVSGLKPAMMGDSDGLQVGQQVVAVGAPFGLESTVTTGVVSALNRPVATRGADFDNPATAFPAVQTDAAINPGNSGGPLVDLSGRVVGINSAIKTASSSAGEQSGSIGLGFAIPSADAVPIVEQLRRGETPTHARIGVSVVDATDDVGLPSGALVRQVEPGTAGDEAGIEVGQVITRVDDHVIANSDSLVATIRSYRPGDTVVLTVARANSQGVPTGDPETISVKLGSDA